MKAVFADSFHFLALLNDDEAAHQQAVLEHRRKVAENTATAVTGRAMTATVTQTSGEAFFVRVGETYTIEFGTSDYTFTHREDVFTGTYTYDLAAGANTATLIFDPGTENQIDSTLTFTDETSGTISSTGAGNSSETATFTLSGP